MKTENKQNIMNEIQEFLEVSPYTEEQKKELTIYISELTNDQEDIMLENGMENYYNKKYGGDLE